MLAQLLAHWNSTSFAPQPIETSEWLGSMYISLCSINSSADHNLVRCTYLCMSLFRHFNPRGPPVKTSSCQLELFLEHRGNQLISPHSSFPVPFLPFLVLRGPPNNNSYPQRNDANLCHVFIVAPPHCVVKGVTYS